MLRVELTSIYLLQGDSGGWGVGGLGGGEDIKSCTNRNCFHN